MYICSCVYIKYNVVCLITFSIMLYIHKHTASFLRTNVVLEALMYMHRSANHWAGYPLGRCSIKAEICNTESHIRATKSVLYHSSPPDGRSLSEVLVYGDLLIILTPPPTFPEYFISLYCYKLFKLFSLRPD